MSYYEHLHALESLEVTVSELLMATPDMSDPLLDPSVHQVLKLLRDQHAMEAAFACEFVEGRQVSHRREDAQRAQFRRIEPDLHRAAVGEQLRLYAGDDFVVIRLRKLHFGRRRWRSGGLGGGGVGRLVCRGGL